MDAPFYKDAILDQLSAKSNVAQFVSFDPSRKQRFARVRGFAPNHLFPSALEAISALLQAAPDSSINLRSYQPGNSKSREFIYGIRTVGEIMATLERLSGEGLFTIANETIDVDDGGVSGVVIGELMEFAPGDTPRSVEKPGTALLSRQIGLRLLETVYHFTPALDYDPGLRVEFSIHPLRRGFRNEHTIVWEVEPMEAYGSTADIRWPNLFSRLLGDKAFGLLIAHHLGFPVPATTVIPRGLAPFTFGTPTGTGEVWIRTCPVVQEPGKYTTKHGWIDPYKLLAEEDPDGTAIASVLAQESVDARYSGALVSNAEGVPTVEGVAGWGDDFMVGRALEVLPEEVKAPVIALFEQAKNLLGPVRFEWVYDGERVWIVQFHRGASASVGRIVYPGDPESYITFDVKQGLSALRELIRSVQGTEKGIILSGNVGVTSHFGDILRRAQIPSRIEDA